MARVCRGCILHRVGTRTKVDRWKAMTDYPNPAYLRMTVHGAIPADLSDGVGKVITSVECKSIRIAESSVMDGWDDRFLAQRRFCFKKVFSKKWRKVPGGVLGGYYRGTVVVRGTCRVLPRKWRWSCVIDQVYREGWSCLIDHWLFP
jgi:hypothetical protein